MRRIHPKPSLPTPSHDPTAAERKAFERQRASLMRRYAGQYVAFLGGCVVGHHKDDEELAAQMFKKYGDARFYIGHLTKEPAIYEVPSPELAESATNR